MLEHYPSQSNLIKEVNTSDKKKHVARITINHNEIESIVRAYYEARGVKILGDIDFETAIGSTVADLKMEAHFAMEVEI